MATNGELTVPGQAAAAPELQLFVPGLAPFAMPAAEKAIFLASRLAELLEYHRERCPGYARLLTDWEQYGGGDGDYVQRYPFVPVTVFKEYDLKSVAGEVAVVRSSATTSTQASRIYIDKASRKRQSRSANLILTDFIGAERRPYIVFDLEETVRGAKAFSARGAAILALAHLATEFHFVLREGRDGPELDPDALHRALAKIGDAPFIAYGFTFMLYNAHRQMASLDLPRAHPDSVLLHSGGWKKLVELAVGKPVFNGVVSGPWGLRPDRVVDFYGAVEQIGMPYPDCSEGYKHVPYWADVITRRGDTLAPAPTGESGLIQLISCLPLAAPNHSVLTEDLGRIVHADGCPCGRPGKSFLFEGRAPRSEVRGCSEVPRR